MNDKLAFTKIIGVDGGSDDKSIIVEGYRDADDKLIITNCYEYLSVEECIRRNGHRHLERAIAYASAGYPDRFYEGSMKKALKQYKKAEMFKTPEWMMRAFGHMLVDLADKVADEIIS